jgi:hypothetical protein
VEWFRRTLNKADQYSQTNGTGGENHSEDRHSKGANVRSRDHSKAVKRRERVRCTEINNKYKK